MDKFQLRSIRVWRELNRYNRFSAFCPSRSGEPGKFDKSVRLKFQESSVMGMTLVFKARLKEERSIDFRLHEHCAWRGKPAIELLRPSLIKRAG